MHSKVCFQGFDGKCHNSTETSSWHATHEHPAPVLQLEHIMKHNVWCLQSSKYVLFKPDSHCGVKFKGPLEFQLSRFGRLVESSRKMKGGDFPALELPPQAEGGTSARRSSSVTRVDQELGLTAEEQCFICRFEQCGRILWSIWPWCTVQHLRVLSPHHTAIKLRVIVSNSRRKSPSTNAEILF